MLGTVNGEGRVGVVSLATLTSSFTILLGALSQALESYVRIVCSLLAQLVQPGCHSWWAQGWR